MLTTARVAVTLAFASVLAGCVAPPAALDAATPALSYLCDGEAAEIPCPSPVAGDAAYFEPAAAISPADPRLVAVAATVRLAPDGAATGMPPTSDEPNVCRVAVFVSRDGGATWETRTAPRLPLSEYGIRAHTFCERSPSVAFDRAGALHLVVAGVATSAGEWVATELAARVGPPADPLGDAGLREASYRVFHARSDDAGDTWSAPSVLHRFGNHAAIAIDPATGRAVVTIRDFAEDTFSRAAVAWSDDGGATWSGVDGEFHAPCHLPTRAVFAEGRALFACNDHSQLPEAMRLRVYAFDAAARAFEGRAEVVVPDARNLFPSLARAGDGRLALAWTLTIRGGGVDGDVFLAVSGDDGRTFGPERNVRAQVAPESDNLAMSSVAADAQGRFHLAIATEEEGRQSLRHVAADGAGAVTHAAVVVAWADPPDAGRSGPVETAFPRALDAGYPGFAFGPEGGVLASAWNLPRALVAARIAA